MNTLDNVTFIYLDDVRMPPSNHWIIVRDTNNAYIAIRNAVKEGRTIVASLDHDLGEDMPTGYDLLNWIERDIVTENEFRPNISFTIHSANPVGRQNMERAIRSIERLLL